MGDKFTPPTVEKRNSAVTAQVEAEQQNTQQNESRVVSSTVDIYKNGIDDFVAFLKGEIAAGSLEERRNMQKRVIQTCWGMFELDYPQFKESMDYFLITVGKNQNAFEWNNVVAPLATLEGVMGNTELTRYKRTIMFVSLLSEHARSRNTFTQMFDMTKFTAMFPKKSAQNLHNYVHR